ncbi:hypothetical protein FRB98_000701 [Tulasnella sp. 332]|nr:hypothetical protein FRB98_000701 [Tulasnella sp. 332]
MIFLTALGSNAAELEQIIQTQDAQLSACVCRDRDTAGWETSNLSVTLNAFDPPLFTQVGPTSAPRIVVSSILPSSQSPGRSGIFEWENMPLICFNDPQSSSASPMPETAALSTEIWPVNIPPLELLHHLAETVFAAVPLANRILHRPTFMASLAYPPSSHEFPHVNLLHAICALASMYTPIVTDVNPLDPEADVHEGGAAVFSAGIVNRQFTDDNPRFFPRRQEDLGDVDDENDFAAVHLKWCWTGMKTSIRRGDALIQQTQATLIGAWFYHSRGLIVTASSWLGTARQLLHTLGVNVSPELGPLSRIPKSMLYSLGKPKTSEEAELRRNLFWAVYSTERILNAFNVYPSGFGDEDCSQILPCCFKDFEAKRYVPAQGRQRILGRNALVTHPKLTTDSFTLYVKATVILGKVKYFNRSFRYRYTDGDEPCRTSTDNTTTQLDPDPANPKPMNCATSVQPQHTEEFKALDNLIQAFITNIPKEFRDPVGFSCGAKLDPILYMTHMLPHMATIALHDPHAKVSLVQDPSAQKILAAARAILDLIYKVCATTYDLLYLDHSSSKAWFVAGVTLIRFLCVRTVQNDEAEVARLTEEVGAVKFILENLGDRTRIGLRQIKLLETVYMMEMAAARQTATITQLATLKELSP